MTREEWLLKIVDRARPIFAELGAELPENIRPNLAPPHKKMKAIGLCWHGSAVADGGREIWISSEYDQPMEVCGILVHELAHAALPDRTGHKAPFVKLARALHLEGKATATSIGQAFFAVWEDFVAELGPIPGAKFNGNFPTTGRKPQETIPLKNLRCPDCGFFAKVKEDSLAVGRLRCPLDDEMLLTKDEGGE